MMSDGVSKFKTIPEIRREAPDENYEEFVKRVKRHVTPEYRQYLQVRGRSH